MEEIKAYTLDDIADWVGRKEIEKGNAYLSAVIRLEIKGNEITAKVQGTHRTPYHVRIIFDKTGTKPTRLNCSCPVGFYCKHTAAVLLKAMASEQNPDEISPSVLTWLDKLAEYTKETQDKKTKVIKNKTKLFYALRRKLNSSKIEVTFFKAIVDKENKIISRKEDWFNVERAIITPPNFVDDADLNILRQLYVSHERDTYRAMKFTLRGQQGDKLLRQILATGKLYIETEYDFEPVKSGPIRPATMQWKTVFNEQSKPVLETIPASSFIIACDPCWYFDDTTKELGQVETDIPYKMLTVILETPLLTEKERSVVSSALKQSLPSLEFPSDISDKAVRMIDAEPKPVLILDSKKSGRFVGRDYLDFALLQFQYGDIIIDSSHQGEFVTDDRGDVVRIHRNSEQEKKAVKQLKTLGMERISEFFTEVFISKQKIAYQFHDSEEWISFIKIKMPRLEKNGWQVQIKATFRHLVFEVDEWQVEMNESDESGWFDLSMGIVVDGKTLSLTPLLASLFKRDLRWSSAKEIKEIADDEAVYFSTPDGKRFSILAERLKPIAQTLIDLFDGDLPKISRYDVSRFAELFEDTKRWQFKNAQAIIELAKRLSANAKIKKIAQPNDFAITLRPYQVDGLSWLQYLRENQLSGILADDMGLGKTAQTLAHLQLEKEAGRLKAPTLAVLPTSLVFNWRNEAEKFAPNLSVLVLHGSRRKEQFALIEKSDLVLTTYPLLSRDSEELKRYHYYYLILDEAQMVKNAKTQASSVIREIKSDHRLCITGTPLENHLGELWSQFDFLMPGFLGGSKDFTKFWRTPIEKHGDGLRKEILAKRIRPFILRRAKEDVAKELPPKTTIVRAIKLEKGQRDLYETVRSAMDKKVREAIEAQGFKRSQIVILDALLKLRQVCCDPRLLSSDNAKKVQERAKLSFLMDMLDELLAEGRRILLFSQFTSMLSLIEEVLNEKEIQYVKLTGQTRDREKPINAFQNGEVPLFLISLKSGGVGLNLTAADTVIHYDPWWNPAVENQATDRAHRLGQTKPIFVYKLIIEGSIEERIVALQEKKAKLASSVLSQDNDIEVKFGEDDLRALFAPLPE
jgi:superfamily II DNA or RNA helicase